jgi:aspartyl-tRNA(Asn)/glutamyl-tRNA(Gln) amidotransferase subunit A
LILSDNTPNTPEHFAHALTQGSITSVELVNEALERIADESGQGPVAFIRVFEQSAREQAIESDARRAAGQLKSKIDGLPISVKDLFDIEGCTTRAGSVVLTDEPNAQEDALVIQRLREAGAIVLGTTNMTEFAYSGLGLNPHYGTPLSPFDRQRGRIAGGSSSGAAVSVSDGMAVGAIGTDTGGSVRIPAAFCGLVGYKPTASRIDMRGTLPLSPNLDSIGPITNSVTGCAWLASVMAGQAIETPQPCSLEGVTFGVPNELVLDDMDEVVSASFTAACVALEEAGATVVSVPLPELLEIAQLNAAGGFTAAQAWAWHAAWLNSRQDEYDPRVAVRIRRGETLDAAYVQDLQRQREDWIKRVGNRMANIDALAMPTVPMAAPLLEPLLTDDDLYAKTNLLALRNPTVVNFLDGCAVSLPCHEPGQAPVGFMLAALGGQDTRLLELAKACEAVLGSQ